jgi:hypothetical protein
MSSTELLESESLNTDDVFILEALVAIEMSRRERGMGNITLDHGDRLTCEPLARLRSKLRRLMDEAAELPLQIDRQL